MNKLTLLLAVFGAFLLNFQQVQAASLQSKSPADAQVYFIAPTDGAVVKGKFKVKFGLSGMGVAPAGMDKANTGHHHLLVDMNELPALDKPLPATEHVLHFGAGQTETMIELPAGEHTLQLLLGNWLHIPHQAPVFSKKIRIIVK